MENVLARLSHIGWTLYSPLIWLKHRLKIPRLQSPDLRSLDICWNQIFRDQIYRHDRFNIRSNNAVMFDVGANVGLFSAWATMYYRPARIFCFEPDPVTFPFLTRNMSETSKAAPATAITPVHMAVSAADDKHLTLYHSPTLCASSTMLPVGKKLGWQPFNVTTTTISRQMRDRGIDEIDLLKIDVEGHALEVLRGIGDDDFARIRNIALECDYLPEGGSPKHVMRDLLASRGYETEFDDPTLMNNLTLYAWRQ